MSTLTKAPKFMLKMADALANPYTPNYIIFYVTSVCNARCRMCFYWESIETHDKTKELSFDQIEKLSRSFKNLIQVTLTGGEPFLRDELPEIVRAYYKNSGAMFFAIPTNGYLPNKQIPMVRQILKNAPDARIEIALSIDGTEETHDFIRKVPGGYKKLKETYKELKKLKKEHPNLIITSCSTLSMLNLDNMKENIKDLMTNWEFDKSTMLLCRGNPKEPDVKEVSIDDYIKMTEYIKSFPQRIKKYEFSKVFKGMSKVMMETLATTVKENKEVNPCLAGKKLLIIYQNGDVFPCEILDIIHTGGIKDGFCLGNIKDYDMDITKLLSTEKTKNVLDFIKKVNCHCSFECALFASMVFNPKTYSKIIKEAIT